jgi:hypothetical protein
MAESGLAGIPIKLIDSPRFAVRAYSERFAGSRYRIAKSGAIPRIR